MARIFITGSSDGLGMLAAKDLIAQGHKVVLHARNSSRYEETIKNVPEAEKVLIGDLTRIDETVELAAQVNSLGTFDAVIHNAGLYNNKAEEIFAVNTLAPYILTSLITPPGRLIYMSSGMHLQGHAKLDFFKTDINRITYSDTKLHVLMLCFAVVRLMPKVYSNAVNPGWVPTKMGGKGAPDNLVKGYETQVWLAVSNSGNALVTGKYFHHLKEDNCNSEALDFKLQDKLIALCKEMSGISFPV